MLLALIGGVIGVGARRALAVRRGLDASARSSRCRSCRQLHAGELALALLYGLLTALAFALWPLGRAHDVPVGALFRDMVAPQPSWPRAIYIALTARRRDRAGGACRAAGL